MKNRTSAVLSDVHGNLPALEAVLRDAEKRGADGFVNLGDHLYGPLYPAETCDVLMQREIPCLLGNQDRILLEPPLPHPTFGSVMEQLQPRHFEWLSGLPSTMVLEDLLLCHGSPADDTAYLLEEVSKGVPNLRSTENILADLSPHPQTIILCGHTHIPRVAECRGKLIINPGSVGLPAYDDDQPVPHRMEAGSPHARYALLSIGDHETCCSLVSVQYDHEASARTAENNGRKDWAKWLRTGRCE